MYSFVYVLTAFRLISMHIGVRKVVKTTKGSEIPSKPIWTDRFAALKGAGIQFNSYKNWKFDVDLSERIHGKVGVTRVVNDVWKAIS